MTKILGYTDGEISRLYILSTSLVVVICLLLSLPIERQIMEVLFREMMLSSISGWITMWVDPMIYVKNDGNRNRDLCSGSSAGISENPSCAYG